MLKICTFCVHSFPLNSPSAPIKVAMFRCILILQIPVGIGMATNVRVSNNVGARYLAVAQRAALQGPCLCATATITQAAILMQSREQWASLFTSDEDLVRQKLCYERLVWLACRLVTQYTYNTICPF